MISYCRCRNNYFHTVIKEKTFFVAMERIILFIYFTHLQWYFVLISLSNLFILFIIVTSIIDYSIQLLCVFINRTLV